MFFFKKFKLVSFTKLLALRILAKKLRFFYLGREKKLKKNLRYVGRYLQSHSSGKKKIISFDCYGSCFGQNGIEIELKRIAIGFKRNRIYILVPFFSTYVDKFHVIEVH